MNNVTALISMLHEGNGPLDSAGRTFRNKPVLSWTLARLQRSQRIAGIAIMCWDDQLPDVAPVAQEAHVRVLNHGQRATVAQVTGIAAARRWADGWRGGLLQTCHFDVGFYGPWALEAAQRLDSDALVLVDPAAGLVDPTIIDDLVNHAIEHPDLELIFSPAAPGLGAALLQHGLLERLAQTKGHPGRQLHYCPQIPLREPIAGDQCVPVPTPVARTTHRFSLDSERQIRRIERATVSLNGQLIRTVGEDLVARLDACGAMDALPREIVLELNTERATSPIFWPGKRGGIHRAPMTLAAAEQIFEQLKPAEDIRLTIAGVGDPLLSANALEIIAAAHQAGITAINVETDLVNLTPSTLGRLGDAHIDIVSVHLPALTPTTYEKIMGIDAYTQVIENIKTLVPARLTNGTPLIVPIFTKCQENVAEMENWYDQWLRVLGCATIIGASDFGGLIPDVAVADMSPPRRRACARLSSRMTILSDGSVVSCEQDVLGKQIVGNCATTKLSEIWRNGMGKLRIAHAAGDWDKLPACTKCREWHRP